MASLQTHFFNSFFFKNKIAPSATVSKHSLSLSHSGRGKGKQRERLALRYRDHRTGVGVGGDVAGGRRAYGIVRCSSPNGIGQMPSDLAICPPYPVTASGFGGCGLGTPTGIVFRLSLCTSAPVSKGQTPSPHQPGGANADAEIISPREGDIFLTTAFSTVC